MNFLQSFGQISIDTTSNFYYDSLSKSTSDFSQMIGMWNMTDGHYQWFNKEELSGTEGETSTELFAIDTINKSDFEKYKRKYHSKINLDTSLVVWTDTTFIISYDNSKKIFKADKRDYNYFDYYVGFLEPLNLYITLSIDGHNEVGTLIIHDKKTGKDFNLLSPFDEPLETVLISPKKTMLLSFANTWYENDHCFISVLKIDKSKNKFKLMDSCGLFIDKVNISQVVWINEKSFALSVKEKLDPENTDSPEKETYLKASFLKPQDKKQDENRAE